MMLYAVFFKVKFVLKIKSDSLNQFPITTQFSMSIPSLELQLQTLPDRPGVYQYFDKEGKILYVGKAKNIKKRVSSYFTKSHDNHKTAVLVKQTFSILKRH